MIKRMVAAIVVASFALSFAATAALAKPPADKRFKHADRNKDGTVDRKEMHMERKAMAWKHGKAKVNTPVEQKYDKNGDGWLDPAETKEMLKDKHALIATHGKAKVDTAIEAEYDTNKDGILDLEEAKAMKADSGS